MPCFVILGAGQAGGWAAKTLRDQKFAGKVVLVGDEPHPPYERPPLSKSMLLGTCSPAETYLWPPEKLTDAKIDLLLGYRAISIRRDTKSVLLSNGEALSYDRLMIATGSRVRKLDVEGVSLPGIHYLRGIEDALAIQQSLSAESRVLIVGGGWIGLEIAAAARQKNADVTLVEASDRLCSRALPLDVAHYLHRSHKQKGVRILLNTTVGAFCGTQKIEFAELSTGDRVATDCVVIGVGVTPNSEIAAEAGLDVNNGIVVDECCRTSDDSVFAAGDVANQPDGHGGRMRMESWANAQNQAIAAAKTMAGTDSRYSDIPYFWSDQYEMKLQILGSFTKYDETCTRSDGGDKFVSFYVHDRRLVATIGVNCPQDVAAARRIMQKGMIVNAQRLAVARNLSDVLREVALNATR